MRAPLLLLTTAAVALAAVSAACFDWDDLLGDCQDAGNCLGPGGPDSGDGGGDGGMVGDGGDGGGSGGSDSGIPLDGGIDGGLGGPDAGGSGLVGRGQPCGDAADCVTNSCNGYCLCAFNGPCRDDNDCCLGQTCMPGVPLGTCNTFQVPTCSPKDAPCPPGICCSNSCNPGNMCNCSANGAGCQGNIDCCSSTAVCSPGKSCCESPGRACLADEECCSRVCRGNACR
ncbi:MAG TPA: hypothetical protein VIG99_32295 [Myxococcaceae bacterium]|jgi:hypothetical protein